MPVMCPSHICRVRVIWKPESSHDLVESSDKKFIPTLLQEIYFLVFHMPPKWPEMNMDFDILQFLLNQILIGFDNVL